MPAELAPYGRSTQRNPTLPKSMSSGLPLDLGCDGDTISITAATQPSVEDVLLGAIPGLPKGSPA